MMRILETSLSGPGVPRKVPSPRIPRERLSHTATATVARHRPARTPSDRAVTLSTRCTEKYTHDAEGMDKCTSNDSQSPLRQETADRPAVAKQKTRKVVESLG